MKPKNNVVLLVVVAALGYFVDIYDLIIFSIVRIQSFQDIGVPQELMRSKGEFVLNMQMGGLLLGGLIWGIIADKYGRIKVLFGSILLYSLANIYMVLYKMSIPMRLYVLSLVSASLANWEQVLLWSVKACLKVSVAMVL